jgi:hypothetical protein
MLAKKGKRNSSVDLVKLKDTYMRYIALSKYLFASGDSAIYDVNEVPVNNEFHQPAKAIAKSLGIGWEGMTHEESNRIMLALLEDAYNAMAEVEDKENIMIEVKFKIRK